MKNITILGAGIVGKAIALDLSKKYYITSLDINSESLESLSGCPNIKTKLIDISNEKILNENIRDADLVISAVPGFLGYQTLINVIKSKKNIVDISFFPEDALSLNELAKENNVTAVIDCGVAPGMPNYIIGFHNQSMKIEKFYYEVGGLPKERTLPFQYKSSFSPCDVIEEYTRPARFIENGKLVTKPACSDAELVYYKKIGTLEAFNSDGLRSLLNTMNHIPDMREKTLRYPGHINLIQALFTSGFFDKNPININGIKITPFDFTSEILFNTWKSNPGDDEFTVMKICITGTQNGVKKEITYTLFSEYDYKENLSSMARTTGFTATATADMILNNLFNEKGIFPPELIGRHSECFNYVIKYLKQRNINYEKTENIFH